MDKDLPDLKLTEKVKKKLKNKDLLRKEVEQGRSAQEILEISDKKLAKYYEAAYALFVHHRYTDAANAFLFLVTLNPYNHDYWVGLGMASQMCQEYETAIDAYEMAAVCKVDSPVPYFYLAKCLFSIHDRESALQALDLAIEYSEDSEEYADLKKQAIAARKLLLKSK